MAKQKYKIGQVWEAKGKKRKILDMDKYDMKLETTTGGKTIVEERTRNYFYNWVKKYSAVQKNLPN